MTELIGPYQVTDFYLMSELRKSNIDLVDIHPTRYSIAIDKQRKQLTEFYKRRFS
jgi:hypothetical protein